MNWAFFKQEETSTCRTGILAELKNKLQPREMTD